MPSLQPPPLKRSECCRATLCTFMVTRAGPKEQPWQNRQWYDADPPLLLLLTVLPCQGTDRRKQISLLTLKHPTEAWALVKELLEKPQRAHWSVWPCLLSMSLEAAGCSPDIPRAPPWQSPPHTWLQQSWGSPILPPSQCPKRVAHTHTNLVLCTRVWADLTWPLQTQQGEPSTDPLRRQPGLLLFPTGVSL